MPWVGVHERGNEVKAECGSQGDDNDTSTRRPKERVKEGFHAFVCNKVHGRAAAECANDQIDRIDHNVNLNDTKDHERGEV